MFSIREILRLSGVRSFKDEVLGEVHRCPRHNTVAEPTLRAIFVGHSVPYFQCHLCGTSLDPVTMLAEGTQQSLQAAADILQSRPIAFRGFAITPHLDQARRTQKWCSFFGLYRGNYQEEIRSNRLITDPRTDTSTLLYDRCLVKLSDVIREFPELRNFLSLDVGTRKHVIIQMDYNAAGAPGQIKLMAPQGALLHVVHLDHQTPSNHLYFATPPLMLRRSWRDHLAVFNSDHVAVPLWDWVMEWLERSDHAPPVVAISSLRGRPDRADISRVTILPVGLETSWAGHSLSPGLSRVGVCRLPAGCHRSLSAREVLYSLNSKDAWGNLPTVLADFVRVSRNLLDDGNLSVFRSFLEETMSLDYLSREEKQLAVESLGQHVTNSQREMMDRVMSEVCDSPPLDLPEVTYSIQRGCYTRRAKASGKESKITNFRARIILRMNTVAHKKGPGPGRCGGTANLIQVFNESGESIYCLLGDAEMAATSKAMNIIKNSFARKGLGAATIYGREPLLGQIIEGTQGKAPDFVEIAGLGFDHQALSYHYPEVSFTPMGEEKRPLSCRGAVEWMTSQIMTPPTPDEGRDALRSFVGSHIQDGDRLSKALAKAVAISCLFAFKASRGGDEFHLAICQEELLELVARVSGIKMIGPASLLELDEWPLYLGNVPFVMKGVHPGSHARFRFKICQDSHFDVGRINFRISDAINLSGDEVAAVPAGTFALFAESALRARDPESVARNVLAGTPLPFLNRVLGELSALASNGRAEIERLLDFIESDEAKEFSMELPELPGYVVIRKDIVPACFGVGQDKDLKVRLEIALRRAVGADSFVSRRFRGGSGDSRRFYAWAVPKSFLKSNSKVIKIS